ncbi:MAG: complex I subunit 5 family protein [Clostridia bacterium]|nr:complex I subunit 5 family protein [Clostridia bacterium]
MIPACLLVLPILGAVLTSVAAKKGEGLRDRLYHIETVIVFVLALAAFVSHARGNVLTLDVDGICGFGLHLKMDGFRSLYTMIASFMWLMTGLLSKEYFAHYRNKTRYYMFNQLTLLGTLGLFMSDDLYTAFIFFEIMSLSSYPWVAHDENDGAMSAAKTYLAIAVFGGMVTLMGLFMAYNNIGSLSFEALTAARGRADMAVPAALIMVGFGAKAGLFPLYMWLPQAHPVAPAPASALLSGVLTKTGVFGMLVVAFRLMLGNHAFGNVLLALGLITMLLGALLALFSTNLKRILACSSMSQIGYITVGIAMATLLGHEGHVPASGAVMHMVNHSVLKLTLFMAAGVIYMNLHKLELNDIRGFGIGKPLLKAAFLLGSFGLAGVPLFNGYLGKTLIHEGILEYAHEVGQFGIYNVCEWIFLFAAGITTAYMLKIYIALFHKRHPKDQARFAKLNGCYMNRRSAFALICSMVLIPILGCIPQILEAVSRMCEGFTGIEGVEGIHYFSFENLRGGAISLLIGTLVYLLVVRKRLWSEKKGYLNVSMPVAFNFAPVVNGFMKVVDVMCVCFDRILDNGFVLKTVPNAATAVMRVADNAADTAILLGKQTVFRKKVEGIQKPHRLFYLNCRVFGTILNFFAMFYDLLTHKRHGVHVDYVYVLAERVHDPDPMFRRATKTVSYALMLFVAGLLAALLYLLFV